MRCRLWLPVLCLPLLWLSLLGTMALPVQADNLDQYPDIVSIFPNATRIGEPQREISALPVYQLNELLGYAFETDELTDFPGFSGEPVNLLIGIDIQGQFVGLKLLKHHEPIFLHGLGEWPLIKFINQYVGRYVTDRIIIDSRRTGDNRPDQAGPVYLDGITKATVSVMVINDTILAAALQVARKKLDGFAQQAPARIRSEYFVPSSASELIARGEFRHWQLNSEAVEAVTGESVEIDEAVEVPDGVEPGTFIDLHYAYLNVPTLGKNILGEAEFQRLLETLRPGEHALAVFSRGEYSFIGDEFVPGTVPGRLAVEQGGLPIDIRDLDFYEYYPSQFPADLPWFDEMMVFRIKAQSGFDPSRTFSLKLGLTLGSNAFMRKSFTFEDQYQLDQQFFEDNPDSVSEAPQPLWMRIWQNRLWEIAVLAFSLVAVSLVFVFQQSLARRGKLLGRVRGAMLLFTLLFIGFYAQGQLSVVNIYTLFASIRSGFDLQVFLLDPILFILWSFVFITLFLWGRGVFCGWLCPFGALQDLAAALAKKLRIRQWKVPAAVDSKLRYLKYLLLVGLVGLSFYSMTLAEQLAEVEPFKTSITLLFVRTWPFVLYAVLLLALGMKVHKFYCRYLCPLGAGLAVLGTARRFSWLRRRNECGSPCQLCKKRCEIDAIKPSGEINYNECVQCLDCIVIINSPQLCVIDKYTSGRKRKAAARKAIEVQPVSPPLPDMVPSAK